MSPESIVCWDPAEFALAAIRDAEVRLGERVAIFGMGAIGLMAVQMARLSGAAAVIAVEPIHRRRALAFRLGADHAVDPEGCDVAVQIRHLTGGKGVDTAIEASGSYPALQQAIRSVGFGGLVVPLAFYTGEAFGLRLGEEWHMNRITMRSSRAISDPNRDHPLWDRERIRWAAFDLLREGKVSSAGVLHPVVSFEDSAEAFRLIDEAPQESVKLGITYG
jgi:threonine dehydrogenase-like Zn-dependent dehydrogenase